MIIDSFPQDILEQVAEKSSLAEGPEGVRSILLNIFRHPQGINNKLLSQLTAIPVPVLSATRQELIKASILTDITSFTSLGEKYVQEVLGFYKLPSSITLENWNPFSPKIINEITDVLSNKVFKNVDAIIEERPEPLKELDQSRATKETVYRRFLFMLINGHIEGRKISLIGDDDGLSLVIFASNLAESVTVFDIDQRINRFLQKSSENLSQEIPMKKNNKNSTLSSNHKINTVEWDLRNPIPKEFTHTQDVIFTDPPYTVPGARLFLQRGRELLNELRGLPLYLAFGPKEPQTHWDLQLSSLNYGFKLSELRKQFNNYRGNLRLGQFSDLYLYQIAFPKSRLIQQTHLGDIYTKEVRDREYQWTQTQNKIINQKQNEKNQLNVLGFHLLAEFSKVPQKNFSVELLKSSLLEACQEAELIVRDIFTYLFSPFGISILAILQESHISLHTWPEYRFISLDIFVCDEQSKADRALSYLTKKLNPAQVTKLPVIRGEYPYERLNDERNGY